MHTKETKPYRLSQLLIKKNTFDLQVGGIWIRDYYISPESIKNTGKRNILQRNP